MSYYFILTTFNFHFDCVEIFIENISISSAFNREKTVSVPLGEKKNVKVARIVVIALFH